MGNYILRRLLLLPLTLFCIVLVNFVVINLAPGDPVSFAEISQEGGASRREDRSVAFGSDQRYLQFREFYGLTLPILFNNWPSLSLGYVQKTLWQLVHHRSSPESQEEMPLKEYDNLRITFGDQARFIMPHLLTVLEDPQTPPDIRELAARFFARGGSRQGYIGANLTPEQKAWNRRIAQDDLLLRSFMWTNGASSEEILQKVNQMRQWYEQSKDFYHFNPGKWEKLSLFFFETRFMKYMGRIVKLDFGTLRNDSSKTVLSEVVKRFKYSLTLALIPMLITFILCQFFGFLMAFKQSQWPDYLFNLLFLVLYAIPVFVVAPFLIEKVALYHTFPFTSIPIPFSGFTNPDRVYDQETSYQRLLDIVQHIALPILAIMYGSLASESRLSRTAVLEVLRQDYIRTARAKGVPPSIILFKHVGRNAAITIVTSLAGSLGIILGGSLIVETLFDINGFGKFFYEAIINRDYNVIMFSALAGSFLSLLGYLVADLAYMWLDPRITLE
ncbi:ABC transporter permease [Candidatus Protochlamydia phocaeensis]|uniref:ABC transporter permease n=1 Tax=Candidatus Protochlamydia phocaeensis TaxID=1414722 RepID=UPI0008388D55|nr:ABC transporter permease [Candidatus Protochlamydia phocaeensis]